jgi:predicted transcriptional regulator
LENESVEPPRKRRDRLYIIAEILVIAKDGSLKTQIMYRANLSFAQLNEYLSFLLKISLLKKLTRNEKTFYKTTPKGVKYLENYEKITNLLTKEGENPFQRNSPIFLLKRNPMGY